MAKLLYDSQTSAHSTTAFFVSTFKQPGGRLNHEVVGESTLPYTRAGNRKATELSAHCGFMTKA